jgi:hypothetical protein
MALCCIAHVECVSTTGYEVKEKAMANNELVPNPETDLDEQWDDQAMLSRRDFLAGLRKWSAAVIGVAVAGAVFLPGEDTSGWVNSRGSWINGGGGGWVNRGASWINGHGGGAGWVNRSGGGGSWVNRRGW